MKKQRIIPIISAAALGMSVCSCSSKSSSSSEAEKPVGHTAPKNITFAWQEAYKSQLDSFSTSADFSKDSRFDLRDLNKDGTPELIISPNSTPNSPCQLYTFSGGNIVSLGDNGGYGCFEYYPASEFISNEHSGQGFIIGEFRRLVDGELKTDISYYNNADSAASGALITYEINKEEVTLKEYDEALELFRANPSLTIGRKYTFGQSAIDNAIYCSESWGAVLFDGEKELYRNKLNELMEQYDEYAGFELIDLDNDDVPEMIVSEGIAPEASCRIFMVKNGELSEIEGKYGSNGKIGFDAE
ncbi:MAG: hypothetical protein GXY08_08345, partial [Ruminococcus sp.]|nr:hypothetical protein [Ruminococcus sp.]